MKQKCYFCNEIKEVELHPDCVHWLCKRCTGWANFHIKKHREYFYDVLIPKIKAFKAMLRRYE